MNFTLIYGPYRYLVYVLFGPILMENFVCFFKCSLNFKAHALQSELNKVRYTNFVKFRLQSMSSKIEQLFGKEKKTCFCLHLVNFNLKVIFQHFIFNFFFLNISYPKSYLNFCDEYHFSSFKNCHKSGKNLDFSEKFNFPWNQLDTIVFFVVVFFTCMTRNQSKIIK